MPEVRPPAPSIDPARWGSARTAEVYSVTTTKNGLVTSTIYTGPPGMSAVTMYAELKAFL